MSGKKLSFANVTSFLALFVALSAGSYAAIKIPAKSVGTPQLKSKAVTSAKLASGAATGPKIAADAIDGSKVADGSLTSEDINLAILGKVPSANAADTAEALSRVKTLTAVANNRPAAGQNQCPCPIDVATATCEPGYLAVGGGAGLSDQANQLVQDSYPSGAGSWTAHVAQYGTATPAFTVYVLCIPARGTQ